LNEKKQTYVNDNTLIIEAPICKFCFEEKKCREKVHYHENIEDISKYKKITYNRILHIHNHDEFRTLYELLGIPTAHWSDLMIQFMDIVNNSDHKFNSITNWYKSKFKKFNKNSIKSFCEIFNISPNNPFNIHQINILKFNQYRQKINFQFLSEISPSEKEAKFLDTDYIVIHSEKRKNKYVLKSLNDNNKNKENINPEISQFNTFKKKAKKNKIIIKHFKTNLNVNAKPFLFPFSLNSLTSS